MIAHHLTLEHVARELHSLLSGMRLSRAWSQQKYVASMIFADDTREVPVVVDVSAQDACVTTRATVHRALRNSIDLFPELLNQTLAAVVKVHNDRIISFVFEHHVLHAELFSGGRGNIVLCEESRVIDALRSRAERIGRDFKIASSSTVEPFHRNDRTVLQDLATCTLHLGRYYASEVCHRAGIDHNLSVGVLTHEHRSTLLAAAGDLISLCHESPRFLTLTRAEQMVLSLLPLHGWTVAEEHTSVIDAIRHVTSRRRALRSFLEQRQRRLRSIDAVASKLDRTLAAVLADEAAPLRPARYRALADTLMAQPNIHSSGQDHLDAMNVVTGQIERIPLRTELTILENAKALYAKARDAESAARRRELRIPELERRITELAHERRSVEAATTASDLPKHKTTMDTPKTPTGTPKFREFRLDDSHVLYVGRNASNNDELTMKFAKQQDWWMHVRGASGSHAVLRGVAGERIPKPILEKAAAITAYYSQARNASYVPVVYTQRKYVRKPKGANVGAVVVDREQTVMVRPGLPDGTLSEE